MAHETEDTALYTLLYTAEKTCFCYTPTIDTLTHQDVPVLRQRGALLHPRRRRRPVRACRLILGDISGGVSVQDRFLGALLALQA